MNKVVTKISFFCLHQSENLSVSAQGFRRGANRVRKQMWWKDMKMRIILAIVIILILLAIICE